MYQRWHAVFPSVIKTVVKVDALLHRLPEMKLKCLWLSHILGLNPWKMLARNPAVFQAHALEVWTHANETFIGQTLVLHDNAGTDFFNSIWWHVSISLGLVWKTLPFLNPLTYDQVSITKLWNITYTYKLKVLIIVPHPSPARML